MIHSKKIWAMAEKMQPGETYKPSDDHEEGGYDKEEMIEFSKKMQPGETYKPSDDHEEG